MRVMLIYIYLYFRDINKNANLPKEVKLASCRLEAVDRILVDVVETAEVDCSSVSDCSRLYEKHYNVKLYFIIEEGINCKKITNGWLTVQFDCKVNKQWKNLCKNQYRFSYFDEKYWYRL
jgi:hypothetical protein